MPQLMELAVLPIMSCGEVVVENVTPPVLVEMNGGPGSAVVLFPFLMYDHVALPRLGVPAVLVSHPVVVPAGHVLLTLPGFPLVQVVRSGADHVVAGAVPPDLSVTELPSAFLT